MQTDNDNSSDNLIPDTTPRSRIKTNKRKRGRPSETSEEKLNKKQIKEKKRLEYIESLKAQGQLSAPEAHRLTSKGMKPINAIPNMVDPKTLPESAPIDPSLIGTKDDPYLEKRIQASLIAEKGGRGISLLYPDEKVRILEHLQTGMGRSATCLHTKIAYSRFINSFRHDPIFRQEVVTVEKSLIGLCEMHIYAAAQNGDVSSAERFIRLKNQQNQAVFGNKLAVSEHNLKKKAVEAQIGAMTQQARPSFACLTNEELDDYNNITTKIQSGQPASPEEYSKLGIISAKLIRANSPQPQPPTDFVAEVAQSPDVSKSIENMTPEIETTFVEEEK